jgi:methylaspartate mutase sigma subunit
VTKRTNVDYRSRTVVLSGTASDSHTWNLVYLQLFLEERGYRVVNLGPCVPDALLVERCRAEPVELVVLSSVNGHGYRDGLSAITRLRAQPDLAGLPVVIGGKLGVHGRRDALLARRLRDTGAAAVFDDGDIAAFERFLAHRSEPARVAERPVAA